MRTGNPVEGPDLALIDKLAHAALLALQRGAAHPAHSAPRHQEVLRQGSAHIERLRQRIGGKRDILRQWRRACHGIAIEDEFARRERLTRCFLDGEGLRIGGQVDNQIRTL